MPAPGDSRGRPDPGDGPPLPQALPAPWGPLEAPGPQKQPFPTPGLHGVGGAMGIGVGGARRRGERKAFPSPAEEELECGGGACGDGRGLVDWAGPHPVVVTWGRAPPKW